MDGTTPISHKTDLILLCAEEGRNEGGGMGRKRDGRESEVLGKKGASCAAGMLGWRKQAHRQDKNHMWLEPDSGCLHL